MGVKKINGVEDFINKFVRARGGDSTGLDAVNPAVDPDGHTATGGNISDYTSGSDVYRAHVFTASGDFDITALGGYGNTVDYLVVAGGGGGGPQQAGTYHSAGGAGGAGGLRTSIPGVMPATSTALPVAVATYSVVVGGGGAGNGHIVKGSNGVDSSLQYNGGTITSTGGGGGGATNAPADPVRDGADGGSGGGCGGNQHVGTSTGGAATPNSDPDRQGYPGAGPFGTAPQNSGGGAGGGGAGAAAPLASYPTSDGLVGGVGVQVAIAGPTATTFTGMDAGERPIFNLPVA